MRHGEQQVPPILLLAQIWGRLILTAAKKKQNLLVAILHIALRDMRYLFIIYNRRRLCEKIKALRCLFCLALHFSEMTRREQRAVEKTLLPVSYLQFNYYEQTRFDI